MLFDIIVLAVFALLGLSKFKGEISWVMDKYRIKKIPNLTAQQNIDSWKKLEDYLDRKGSATFQNLVQVCSSHDHTGGGEGFVNYCVKNDWIVKI